MKQFVGVELCKVVEGGVELLERLMKPSERVVVNVNQLVMRHVQPRQPNQAIATDAL